jgi:hypothetical protein
MGICQILSKTFTEKTVIIPAKFDNAIHVDLK